MVESVKYPSGYISTNLRAACGLDEEGHYLEFLILLLKTSRDGLLTTSERSLFQLRTIKTAKEYWKVLDL